MNHKTLYALLCSILFMSQCFSFGIQFTTLHNPQNNALIHFIGDWHSYSPEEVHKEQLFDAAFFSNDLKILLQKNCKIIFEGSPELIKHTVQKDCQQYGLRKLSQDATTNHMYLPSDIRTGTLELLVKLYLPFNRQLTILVTDLKQALKNKFDATKNPQMRFILENALAFCNTNSNLTIINTYLYQTHSYITTDEVLEIIRRSLYYPHDAQTPITIATLEHAFIKNSAIISNACNKIKQQKPEYATLIDHLRVNLYAIYKQGIAYFANLKNRFTQDTDLVTMLFKLGQPYKTIAYSCGQTNNNPFSDFYLKLTLQYSDIYFTTQALMHEHALIFAGKNHCTAIINTLLKNGFVQNYQSTLDKNKPYPPQETTKFLQNGISLHYLIEKSKNIKQ